MNVLVTVGVCVNLTYWKLRTNSSPDVDPRTFSASPDSNEILAN